MASKQEDFQNRILALLLTEQGVAADFEQREGRRRMDVVTEVEGLRVILEAETGFHRKAQAIKDADARLRQRLATAVFRCLLPRWRYRGQLGRVNADLDSPRQAGRTGGRMVYGQCGAVGPSGTAGAAFPDRCGCGGAITFGRPGHGGAAVDNASPTGTGARPRPARPPNRAAEGRATATSWPPSGECWWWPPLCCSITVCRDYLPADRPGDFDGSWPPAGAVACAEQDAVINAYREAWRGILAVDYRPVFETGRTALAALSADPDTGQAVRHLAEVVARISERVTGLRHDLLGRIFHRVLDTARYDGSFYTSTAAAVLARLSGHPRAGR